MSVLTALRRLLKRFSAPEKNSTDPSGRALARAKTIAFVCPSAADADGPEWIAKAKARGAEVDALPLFQPHRRADGKILSFVAPPPRPAYDCIVVSHRLALFEHSWSYAFLDRLNSLLANKGSLLIQRCDDPARQITGARLETLFGRAPRGAARRYLTFAKAAKGLNRPAGAALSTLDAYWPLMEALRDGVFDNTLADTVLALGANRARKRPANSADALALLNRQSYRTCSVRNKAAMVQYLASLYFPGRADLHVVDLGAGTGLNSMELLLNESGVARVTLVEPHRSYHWDIAAVYDHLGARLKGKVALAPVAVERYRGAPADIAMICGVFSVLERETREPFLKSAWANLAPGGILAVLENMRLDDAVRGGRFNDQRFVPEEIDASLDRLGAIRYFRGDAMKEIAHEQAGNATVWRVVRKSLS